jgi:EAL domain-containing protein (putative c-di-GMP-specific phosphodiesterase class I)
VRAIVMMAHSLDLTVVAEGVENETQRTFLERHGCDVYQGHLLSPPLPASKMEQYFRDHQAAHSVTEPVRKVRTRAAAAAMRTVEP